MLTSIIVFDIQVHSSIQNTPNSNLQHTNILHELNKHKMQYFFPKIEQKHVRHFGLDGRESLETAVIYTIWHQNQVAVGKHTFTRYLKYLRYLIFDMSKIVWILARITQSLRLPSFEKN